MPTKETTSLPSSIMIVTANTTKNPTNKSLIILLNTLAGWANRWAIYLLLNPQPAFVIVYSTGQSVCFAIVCAFKNRITKTA